MKPLFTFIILLFIACNSIKTKAISQKPCLNVLILDKEEVKAEDQYLVKIENRTPLAIVVETIKDSISLDALTDTEKNNLIKAIKKIRSVDTKQLKMVKPKTQCGLFFNDELSANTLEINVNYNFFLPRGFQKTKTVDKEIAILKKYNDSNEVLSKNIDFHRDKGSFFKLRDKDNSYFFKNYETFFTDGDFWTMYRISNVLDYDTTGWLKSATSYRSFFKNGPFSEDENEDENLMWHYTHMENKLDKTNSFIKSIIVYYITLDNMEQSEHVGFLFQKKIVTFKPNSINN